QKLHPPHILSKPLPLLGDIQLQRLECSVASLFPARQRAPLRQKLHPPHILSKPLPLLGDIQLQRLEAPVISLSRSKQKALQGRELEVPCDSEQAASAFTYY
ncbi:hypothetical protein PDR94_25170, partial [Bacillus cereus]|nr:hypothetical protein [Bacillus cereus]MDA2721553.1 hypothetical protein [Bacillus cereus]MDA2727311.1 hypothetical protein [Bacillus cereus]